MAEILLDTNVLSELMRPRPDPAVVDWFARRTGDTFFISAITQAEILLGIALLPPGKRRDVLTAAAAAMFAEDFAGRCLPFDAAVAGFYADIVAARRAAGQPVTTEDAQIAAIALTYGYPLATRNSRDFAGIAGLVLYNPWQG